MPFSGSFFKYAMKVNIPFGSSYISAELPENTVVILPNDISGIDDEALAVKNALTQPLGTERLYKLAQGKKTVTIVVNDITRSTPSKLLVTQILKELQKAKIKEKDLTILIACGNHRVNTREELKQMIGSEIIRRLGVINHRCTEKDLLINVGKTSQGIPVTINRHLAEASLKILTGSIIPHQSAGYTGGRKSVLPGVASCETIRKHHSFPFRPYQPAMGAIEDNPFHQVALEAARMVGIDFILNVVPNHQNEIVSVVAGDLELAHKEGLKVCQHIWQVSCKSKFDIVITSPGGYPKDIDLHQAQKAIAPAELITKKGGSIILVAECRDGIGKFESWLAKADDPEDVIERFQKEGFDPKTHSSKAFMFARALARFNLFILTHHIGKERLNKLFLKQVNSIDQALEETGCLNKKSRVAFMPFATNLIPFQIGG